jgi:hypothetical protein
MHIKNINYLFCLIQSPITLPVFKVHYISVGKLYVLQSILPIAAIFARMWLKKTGSIWLGGF